MKGLAQAHADNEKQRNEKGKEERKEKEKDGKEKRHPHAVCT